MLEYIVLFFYLVIVLNLAIIIYFHIIKNKFKDMLSVVLFTLYDSGVGMSIISLLGYLNTHKRNAYNLLGIYVLLEEITIIVLNFIMLYIFRQYKKRKFDNLIINIHIIIIASITTVMLYILTIHLAMGLHSLVNNL